MESKLLGYRQTWISIPILLLISYVNLDKWLIFNLFIDEDTSSYLIGLGKIKKDSDASKAPSTVPGTQ